MSSRKGMPNKFSIYSYWKEKLVNDYGKTFYDNNLECIKNYICFACGGVTQIERAHIIPLCNGGSNDASNLHLLCKPCHVISEHIVNYQEYEEWLIARNPSQSDSVNSLQYKFDKFIDAVCKNEEQEKFPDIYEALIKKYGSVEKWDQVAGAIMYHKIVLNTPVTKYADVINKVFIANNTK